MTTIERQLAEALRQLRKSTGRDWEKVIALRAKFLEDGGSRDTCPKCHGLGETTIDRWSASYGCQPETCTECNGEGEVYIP